VFSWLKNPAAAEETRVHIDDPCAVLTLTRRLSGLLEGSPKKKNPHIVCIGTDRSTGDSLGPLTGWRLDKLLFRKDVSVFGTVDNPIHAQNLQPLLADIAESSKERPVIAVDACLGVLCNVKTILLEEKPLRPGTGVNKILPPVGDVSISGIVNTGGFMEIQVLQNTRLSVVMKMAHIIADGIFLALQKTGRL
jgi:putative sporulation protein YyaC